MVSDVSDEPVSMTEVEGSVFPAITPEKTEELEAMQLHDVDKNSTTSSTITSLPLSEQVQELEYHELALKFNRLSIAQLQELADDIEKNGLLEKITLDDGKILDGINRYEALRLKGKDLKTIRKEYCQKYQGNTPALFVLSKNVYRRHLDLNDSQRAMLVADMETYTHGGNRKNQDGSIHVETRAELAKAAEVSPSSVARAKKIKECSPEDAQDIRDGKTTIGTVTKKLREDSKDEAQSKQPVKVETTQSATSTSDDDPDDVILPLASEESSESKKSDTERLQEAGAYLDALEQKMDLPSCLYDWARRWAKLKIKNANAHTKLNRQA
jgi:ParB-like chromosome segregation protein Spo0J